MSGCCHDCNQQVLSELVTHWAGWEPVTDQEQDVLGVQDKGQHRQRFIPNTFLLFPRCVEAAASHPVSSVALGKFRKQLPHPHPHPHPYPPLQLVPIWVSWHVQS